MRLCPRACMQEALPDGTGEGRHESAVQAGPAQALPHVVNGGPAVGVGNDDVEHLLQAAPPDGLEDSLLQATSPGVQSSCTGGPLSWPHKLSDAPEETECSVSAHNTA